MSISKLTWRRNCHILSLVVLLLMYMLILTSCSDENKDVYKKTIPDSPMTFANKDDMKVYLNGNYVYVDEAVLSGKGSVYNKIIMEQIIIDDTSYKYIYYYAKTGNVIEEYHTIISYAPQNGSFTTMSDKGNKTNYYVVRNGNAVKHDRYGDMRIIRSEGDRGGYVKHEFISIDKYIDPYDTGVTTVDKYETMYTALSFSELKLYSNSSYNICEGKITNDGKKTYRYVKAKGLFKNEEKTVLDTDWTYAIGSEGLSPGESTSFRLSVKKDSRIKYVSVEVFE